MELTAFPIVSRDYLLLLKAIRGRGYFDLTSAPAG
jgi:hypothetical protein